MFVGEHGFAFAVVAFASADVADVALDDLVVVFLVDVADEFDGDVPAVVVEQREVFVADASDLKEPEHGGLVFRDIAEDADLPELLADEIGEGVPEELEHEAVGVDDFSRVGVEDENAVVRGFEEAAVAGFGALDEAFPFAAFPFAAPVALCWV